ncbi:MAG TPA: M48 family metallopeptidase [Acidimicrobiales bacterium]
MASAYPVEIVRSARRRKTVQAVMDDGVIRVHVPATMATAEVDRYVADLVPRLERRFRSDHIDLSLRATALSRRFGLPAAASVAWADNQRQRWGSCTVDTGEIRVTRRLADYPPWVLDYVLVHELAHLAVADHSAAFQVLVDQYPRAERARGYLMAKAGDRGDDGDAGPADDWDDTDLIR